MEFNKIYNGDCLELIKELPDNSVDFICTDPPYFEHLKVNWDVHTKKPQPIREREIEQERHLSRLEASLRGAFKSVENINSSIKPTDWFSEALRVLKQTNMIVWIDDRHQLLDYLLLLEQYDLKFHQLIWHKTRSTPTNNIYRKDKEIALYIYDKPISYNDNFHNRSTITAYSNNSGNANDDNFVKWHPTPKPLHLIKRFIEKHTKKDDVVLDLFSGSGTTCVAAKQLGRQFIGFELDETYYKKSVERLESEGSQAMFNFEE